MYKRQHSALLRLRSGGRLVAITGHNFAPHNASWCDAFARLQGIARVVYSVPLAGSLYYKHGTTFDTRLTVFDKIPAVDIDDFSGYDHDKVNSPDELLGSIQHFVPKRADCAEPKAITSVVQKKKTAVQVAVKKVAVLEAEALEYTIQEAETGDDFSEALYSEYTPQRIRIAGCLLYTSPSPRD